MKILIIAFYYPPEDSWAKMASLRPASWAKYWSNLGHQIYVLTTDKSDLTSPRNEPHIIGVKYWPARSSKAMSLSDREPQGMTSLKGSFYEGLRSVLGNVRNLLKLGSLFQSSDFWLYPALKKALALCYQVNFDVVVSTYGPPANHVIAARLKQATGSFWVADYRDLWHGNNYLQSRGIFSAIEKTREQNCVSKANLITTVSQGLAESLKRKFIVPIHTIENGFDLEDLSNLHPYQWTDNKIRLMYSGTIYPGKQDPSPLFQSLEHLKGQMPDLSQAIEVLFYGWNLHSLQQLVSIYGISDIVTIGGVKSRQEILSLQRSVDALIFLDWNDPTVKGVLTGKLFEYAFSGTPLLGIGSTEDTAAGQLMVQLGVGYPVGFSVDKIMALLSQMLAGQSLAYEPNVEAMQRFTRQHLAHQMLATITQQMHAR